MLIKLTELSQTLLATDDDIMLIDPQNEFRDIVEKDNGSYFDLTPKSGIFLNGFEVSEEVFTSSVAVQKKIYRTTDGICQDLVCSCNEKHQCHTGA